MPTWICADQLDYAFCTYSAPSESSLCPLYCTSCYFFFTLFTSGITAQGPINSAKASAFQPWGSKRAWFIPTNHWTVFVKWGTHTSSTDWNMSIPFAVDTNFFPIFSSWEDLNNTLVCLLVGLAQPHIHTCKSHLLSWQCISCLQYDAAECLTTLES